MSITFRDMHPAASGNDAVRILVATVLLLAAAFKGHQLATEPVLGTGLLNSRWFLIGVVEFQLFFGLWLLAGLLPALSWAAAIACYGILTGSSLYLALTGHTQCGCFGRLPLNMWYTASLDLGIVLALLTWPPPGLRWPAGVFAAVRQLDLPPRPLRALSGVVATWLLVGLPAAFAMGNYADTTLADDGDFQGNGNIVLLEPAIWLGKRFPLLNYIDIDAALQEGEWFVLLYHHDCPKCDVAIRKLTELANRSVANPALPRVALIEMPPYGQARPPALASDAPLAHGRLRQAKQWFVQAPVLQKLSDAIAVPTDVCE